MVPGSDGFDSTLFNRDNTALKEVSAFLGLSEGELETLKVRSRILTTDLPKPLDIWTDDKNDIRVVDAAKNLSAAKRRLSTIETKKILLTSVKGGGGHAAQAKALAEGLKDQGYDTEIVYTDVDEAIDPFNFFTNGRFTAADRYNFFDQRGVGLDGKTKIPPADMKTLKTSVAFLSEILKFYGGFSDMGGLLRDKIEKDPNIALVLDNFPMFASRERVAIASGVPYIRAATDLGLDPALQKSAVGIVSNRGRVLSVNPADPNLVTLAKALALTEATQADGTFLGGTKDEVIAASDFVRAATALSEGENRDTYGTIRDSIQTIKKEAGKEGSPFGFLSYPVRDGIQKLSPEKLDDAKRKLNLSDGQAVLGVSMGSQGKQSVVTTVQALAKQNSKAKIVVAVGSNFDLKKDILAIKETNPTLDVVFADEVFADAAKSTEGQTSYSGKFLDATQMNEFYNTADLLLSKPGGSTAAEIMALDKSIYMLDLNAPEAINAQVLSRMGLGYMHKGKVTVADIGPQITPLLKRIVKQNNVLEALTSGDYTQITQAAQAIDPTIKEGDFPDQTVANVRKMLDRAADTLFPANTTAFDTVQTTILDWFPESADDYGRLQPTTIEGIELTGKAKEDLPQLKALLTKYKDSDDLKSRDKSKLARFVEALEKEVAKNPDNLFGNYGSTTIRESYQNWSSTDKHFQQGMEMFFRTGLGSGGEDDLANVQKLTDLSERVDEFRDLFKLDADWKKGLQEHINGLFQ